MADGEVTCANRHCRVSQDGKCLEGYEDLSKCPHYGRAPEEDEADQAPADVDEAAFDGVHLPNGLALKPDGANRVLGLLPSRVIGVIGAFDSGKTSVIAGLYDLFQMGPVSNSVFAGSSTLHGLELICHDARVASQRNEPHSERTNRGEVRFYHFDVLRDGALRSLLVADRSGEEYEEVSDLAANASAMFELHRADVIAILVDGRRLCSPEHRADAMGAIPLIVRGMVENGAFARRPNLAIVLTKHDEVLASPKKERAMDDFKAIADNLRDSFGASCGELRTFVTCASPKDPKADRGAGLPDLLDFLSEPSAPVIGERKEYRSGRVFDNLRTPEPDIG